MHGKIRHPPNFAPDGLWKWCYKIFQKTWFWQIGVFTKYRWLNATKWPQMPQKLIRTISHGSGHTLDTLNHGLGPLFYCFITLFCVEGSLDPAGTPWRPPGPPGGPLDPLAAPWPLVCHPGSKSVILGHYESYLTHLEHKGWADLRVLFWLLKKYLKSTFWWEY